MAQDNHPMIPVPEAIRIVMRETAKILLTEGGKPNPVVTIPVASTPWSTLLQFVLEKDVLMEEPGYPPYNASIMDGYAIRTAEFSCDVANEAAATDSWTHWVVDKVHAGDEATGGASLERNGASSLPLPSAFYITTGAVVPDTYNCVVPVEQCVVSPDRKRIRIAASAALEDQTWIRPVGCDIPASSVVLPRGHVIDPVAIGLLKQSGAVSIEVRRKTKVGVLSTGNELVVDGTEPAKKNAVGKIPDVNRPILLALLTTYGQCCDPVDLGVVRDDDIDTMSDTVQAALDECDVVITTGGVSMGETDIVRQVLVDRCGGTLHFGRMHMKPGKPTTFVTISKGSAFGTKLVFAMPGNPVSAIVCTQLLVKPCLDLYYQGIRHVPFDESGKVQVDQVVENALVHPEIVASLAQDIKLDPIRPEYHRMTVEAQSDGTFVVSTTGVQQSSRLMSLRDAQALVLLPHAQSGKTKALRGESFPALLLNGNDFGIKRVRMRDSVHLRKKEREMKVGVVEVLPPGMHHLSNLDAICQQIQSSLSGSKSGPAAVVSKLTFAGSADELYSLVANNPTNDLDVIVVCCVAFSGSFLYHLDISIALRKRLTKVANSLALQARQGAASQDPVAPLFEVVVGYVPEQGGAMLICLKDSGMQGALGNIRGLLKHGLNLARGRAHHDHHNRHGHDSTTST